MAKIRGDVALREIRTLFGMGSYGSLTDGELLERFARRREEAGEPAFAALVDRHGRMVLRVCRGVLHDPNDVEDAFQATFLVLARKAGSLWVRDSIGPWLFGVACRIAARARSDSVRRQKHERRAAERTVTVAHGGDCDDLGPVLHEEIDRLPERFRAPLVLCYLAEMSQEQAARQLGWPLGTVRSRLARGRARLRAQLDRRGVAPAFVLPVIKNAVEISAGVRPALTEMTTEAATRFAAGGAGAACVDPAIAALTRGVLRTMILTKLSKIAAVLLVAGLAATGTVGLAWQEGQGESRGGIAVPGLPLATALPPPEKAQGSPPTEAEQIANRLLKAGSDLYDAKNAAALAATYTGEGQVHIFSKSEDQQYKEDVKRGRADIEQFYGDLFRDAGPIDSENTVEVARLIAPDLLVIHGRFRPNTGQTELPFVQMRVKQGPEWLIKELWLFLSPG